MSLYRLAITLTDGSILKEFDHDQLSALAWMENDHYFGHYPKNPFNSRGYQRPETVRRVEITRDNTDKLKAVARAEWYRRNWA